MKIVSIFAEQLFSFHFEKEAENEWNRLLDLWTDTAYLYDFINRNQRDLPKNSSKKKLVQQIIANADAIDDVFHKISTDPTRRLEEFFKPLHNQEYQILTLSKQKGRKNHLRIYALKIDTNCFVITGGAIKFHHLMEDRDHTKQELKKIEQCRDYLKDNGVVDADSFYEFLIEEE